MAFRFGRYRLDTGTRELLRDGAVVRLTGKAYRLLEVLVEHRPRALSKEQLQQLVWPGVFVAQANVASLVTELRDALEDDAKQPALIRTVYGFGYAFSGEVEEDGAPAAQPRAPSLWRLRWRGKDVVLKEGENILGRGPESIEWFDQETVSRRHARVVVDGESAVIEDLGSKNGTTLRGERIAGPVPLATGDRVLLGSVPLTFRFLREAASTATQARNGG